MRMCTANWSDDLQDAVDLVNAKSSKPNSNTEEAFKQAKASLEANLSAAKDR